MCIGKWADLLNLKCDPYTSLTSRSSDSSGLTVRVSSQPHPHGICMLLHTFAQICKAAASHTQFSKMSLVVNWYNSMKEMMCWKDFHIFNNMNGCWHSLIQRHLNLFVMQESWRVPDLTDLWLDSAFCTETSLTHCISHLPSHYRRRNICQFTAVHLNIVSYLEWKIYSNEMFTTIYALLALKVLSEPRVRLLQIDLPVLSHVSVL